MNQLFLSTKSYGCCLLLFIMLCMFGCRPEVGTFIQERTLEVAQLPLMTPTSTETPMIPTNTSTPVSTIVNESTATPSVTSTITPSVMPTTNLSATPTIMVVPTLTAAEEEVLYQNFMATNGGCELPCWWGFHLGDSLENVNQTFISLGMPWLGVGNSQKVDSDQMGTFSAGYADYYEHEQHGTVADYRLSVNMQFHELDGSIEYIYVFVDRVRFEKSQEEFIRDWEQYYLSSFLQRYGKPTQVYFRLRNIADLMEPPQYSVSLLYLEKGLAITYHIKGIWLHNQDAQAELCLDIENVQAIELSLFNPDGFERWGYQFAPYHDELYEPLTWEAEVGMTLDTFYETYQHPENLNCLFLNPG